MNYRIIRYSRLQYADRLKNLYSRNPGLTDKSYDDQLTAIYNSNCMYNNSFSRSMNSFGNQAFDFFSDFEILQKSWAREHKLKYEEESWKDDIMLGQINFYKPEVVYFQDTENISHSKRKSLRDRFPFIRLVSLYSGFPSRLNELDDIDVLIVGTPRLVEQYKKNGFDPSLVYHGFDKEVLSKLEKCDDEKIYYDFSFIGSSGYGYGLGHRSRYWTLKELKNRTNIHLWLEERDDLLVSKRKMKSRISIMRFLEKLYTIIKTTIFSSDRSVQNNEIEANANVPTIPMKKLFKEQCYPTFFGLDMYKILSRSKVTFNMHTDAAEGVVGNMRMFEATGIGTCLLTDTGSNMADLFIEDQEVVTYQSVDECIEKLDYLLDNGAVRKEIALAGQNKTLKNHTLSIRYAEIDRIIQRKL